MTVLADLKGELGYYSNMLMWTVEDDVVKAIPKRLLSLKAHVIINKSFKKQGGHYVSRKGNHYFELVLKPRQLSPGHKIAVAFHELDGQLFKETRT